MGKAHFERELFPVPQTCFYSTTANWRQYQIGLRFQPLFKQKRFTFASLLIHQSFPPEQRKTPICDEGGLGEEKNYPDFPQFRHQRLGNEVTLAG